MLSGVVYFINDIFYYENNIIKLNHHNIVGLGEKMDENVF